MPGRYQKRLLKTRCQWWWGAVDRGWIDWNDRDKREPSIRPVLAEEFDQWEGRAEKEVRLHTRLCKNSPVKRSWYACLAMIVEQCFATRVEHGVKLRWRFRVLLHLVNINNAPICFNFFWNCSTMDIIVLFFPHCSTLFQICEILFKFVKKCSNLFTIV